MDDDLSLHFCRIGVFRRVGGWMVIGFVFFIIKFLRFFFFVLQSRYSVGLWTGWSLTKKKKNYDTQYSHVVPHHSTDCAITSLTSEIGRDPVFSSVYGRNRLFMF